MPHSKNLKDRRAIQLTEGAIAMKQYLEAQQAARMRMATLRRERQERDAAFSSALRAKVKNDVSP